MPRATDNGAEPCLSNESSVSQCLCACWCGERCRCTRSRSLINVQHAHVDVVFQVPSSYLTFFQLHLNTICRIDHVCSIRCPRGRERRRERSRRLNVRRYVFSECTTHRVHTFLGAVRVFFFPPASVVRFHRRGLILLCFVLVAWKVKHLRKSSSQHTVLFRILFNKNP